MADAAAIAALPCGHPGLPVACCQRFDLSDSDAGPQLRDKPHPDARMVCPKCAVPVLGAKWVP